MTKPQCKKGKCKPKQQKKSNLWFCSVCEYNVVAPVEIRDRKYLDRKIAAFNKASKKIIKDHPYAFAFVMPENIFRMILDDGIDLRTYQSIGTGVWFVSQHISAITGDKNSPSIS